MVKRIIILIAAVIGGISTFLPWVTATVSGFGQSVSESVNGTEGDGWITLVLFVAIAAITAFTMMKMKEPMPMWAKVVITVLSVLCIAVAVFDIVDASRLGIDNSSFSAFGVEAGTSIGFGLILIPIAGLVSGVASWLPLDKDTTKKA